MVLLRELKEKDAPFMLEWMHDPETKKWFKKDMTGMSLEDVKCFISQSHIPDAINCGANLHFAIADSNTDEYLGTISLKNVDTNALNAEYAISTRKVAQGKGIAKIATELVLKRAFFDYGLHRVYLSVVSDNINAIHLYEECGFKYEGEFRDHIKRDEGFLDWKWYGILKDDFLKNIR